MIRLAAFAAVFIVMALLEIVLEERPLILHRRTRWTRHGALLVVNTLLVRLLFPAGAVGAAVYAQRHGLGILRVVPLPPWAAAVAAFILLDFLLWLQHVLFHAVPRLFALHRVHHADRDFDATLGIRFHPLEMLLSMALKAGMALLIGAPAFVVVLFELMLNATSIFNHANVRFPRAVDRILRLLVVTPAMHRIHHSEAGTTNIDFHLGYIENIPLPDAAADVIISNGVINLAPEKKRVFREMHRVLKDDGRLQIGDIIVQKAVPEGAKRNIDLWAG